MLSEELCRYPCYRVLFPCPLLYSLFHLMQKIIFLIARMSLPFFVFWAFMNIVASYLIDVRFSVTGTTTML